MLGRLRTMSDKKIIFCCIFILVCISTIVIVCQYKFLKDQNKIKTNLYSADAENLIISSSENALYAPTHNNVQDSTVVFPIFESPVNSHDSESQLYSHTDNQVIKSPPVLELNGSNSHMFNSSHLNNGMREQEEYIFTPVDLVNGNFKFNPDRNDIRYVAKFMNRHRKIDNNLPFPQTNHMKCILNKRTVPRPRNTGQPRTLSMQESLMTIESYDLNQPELKIEYSWQKNIIGGIMHYKNELSNIASDIYAMFFACIILFIYIFRYLFLKLV